MKCTTWVRETPLIMTAKSAPGFYMNLKDTVNFEVGSFLKENRLRNHTNIDLAGSFIGYDLGEIENGKMSIACCDIVRLTEFYRTPRSQVADWFFDIQMKIQKERHRIN